MIIFLQSAVLIAKQPSMDEKATNTATYRTEENLEEPIDVELLTISSNSQSILSRNHSTIVPQSTSEGPGDKMDKKLIEREKVKQEKRMENLLPNIDSRQETSFIQEPTPAPAPARPPIGQNCQNVYSNRGKFDTSPGR